MMTRSPVGFERPLLVDCAKSVLLLYLEPKVQRLTRRACAQLPLSLTVWTGQRERPTVLLVASQGADSQTSKMVFEVASFGARRARGGEAI